MGHYHANIWGSSSGLLVGLGKKIEVWIADSTTTNHRVMPYDEIFRTPSEKIHEVLYHLELQRTALILSMVNQLIFARGEHTKDSCVWRYPQFVSYVGILSLEIVESDGIVDVQSLFTPLVVVAYLFELPR
jgi:hypothetical protein